MTCRIDRIHSPDGVVVLRVVGRIDQAHIEALLELTQKEKSTERLVIDLTEVTVVSLEAVRALTVAEDNGIELRNCPGYLREWICRGRKCGLPG